MAVADFKSMQAVVNFLFEKRVWGTLEKCLTELEENSLVQKPLKLQLDQSFGCCKLYYWY
jgi:hypothetical protein